MTGLGIILAIMWHGADPESDTDRQICALMGIGAVICGFAGLFL